MYFQADHTIFRMLGPGQDLGDDQARAQLLRYLNTKTSGSAPLKHACANSRSRPVSCFLILILILPARRTGAALRHAVPAKKQRTQHAAYPTVLTISLIPYGSAFRSRLQTAGKDGPLIVCFALFHLDFS